MHRLVRTFRRNALINPIFYTKLATMSNCNDIITIDEVRTLKDKAEVLFVDVREPDEIASTGLIPGSINIPLNKLEAALKDGTGDKFQSKYSKVKPDFETPIVFTCRSGRRAGEALDVARKLGFKNVRNYKGSWMEWEKKLPK